MDTIFFFRWYPTIFLTGWLALPIAFRLFKHLPDRGYSFAKPLGLITIGYSSWFLGSLGFFKNDISGILGAFLVIGILGAVWLKREGLVELRDWLKEQWSTVLLVELLFLVAFAGWALVRSYNPDILGTEKPMEFMFINSILRSPTFPLQDAWLSGHAISYYYFGYFLIASLARLTSTPSAVAFNLGLSLLFGLTAIASHGLVMNLIALVNKERANEYELTSHLGPSFWPALLGPTMVLIVGNFYGALELAHNNGLFAESRIPAVWYDFGSAQNLNEVGSLDDFEQKPGIQAGWINFWEWLDLKQLGPQPITQPEGFQWTLPNWFFAARAIHDRNLVGVETEAIDEFPAFSFLLGDMHPHVLTLPFVLLVIALALEWMLTGRDMTNKALVQAENSMKRSAGRYVISNMLLGSLFFLNTWDFPIYLFLTVMCFAFGASLSHGPGLLIRHWRVFLSLPFILLISSLVLYWPFLTTFQSQAGGILPNLIYPTRFQQSAVMFGPVLIAVLLFLIWIFFRMRSHFHWRMAILSGVGTLLALMSTAGLLSIFAALRPGTTGLVLELIAPLSRTEAINLLLQRRLVDSLTAISGALIIGASAAIGLGLLNFHAKLDRLFDEKADKEVREKRASPASVPAVGMALIMILTGALLWITPEFVYLRDNFGTRMNTLFKFYFQTWVLWGVAGAFGFWFIIDHAGRWAKGISIAVMTISILLGSIYLVGGSRSKTSDFAGPPTLDGMGYFARAYPNDWAAIQWLNSNAPGTSVILEGSRGAYWTEGRSSRFSMATGLPTVMGWTNHESQWRGEYFSSVASRQDDIHTIFQTRDWRTAQELLDKYDVDYVIVSSLEQDWYGPIFTDKFDRFMLRVFEQGDVVIYQR